MLTRITCLVSGLALVAAAASAQPVKHLAVDMRGPGHPARALEVDDDALVYVDIQKTTLQSCTVETKTESLPAPPNPIGQALAALNPFLGGAAPPPPPPPPLAIPAGDQTLDALLKSLETDAGDALNSANDQRDATRAALLNITGSLVCTSDHVCENPMLARVRLDLLRQNLGALVDAPAVSVALLNARLAPLSKAVLDKVTAADPNEAQWLRDALARLDRIQHTIDAITDRRVALGKAKDALAPLLERIDTFTPSTTQTVPISVARNAKTTVTVKCTNAVTQEQKIYTEPGPPVVAQDVPPVSTTVVYADMPWAIVTAGMLYSQLDKRQVGAAPFTTGKDAAGVVTFERRVAETDHAKTQIMPFTFLNIPLCRCRTWTPAATAGFGLNTNNGGKVLEYFLGGALIIRGQLGIEVGRHLGSRQEPTNGFALGDVLPEKVTTVPTMRQRVGALAIGLTFKIPLPK